MKVFDIYNKINKFAPFDSQEEWDNSGLLIGSFDCDVNKVLLALDITNDVVSEAIEKKCELIITHHPLIFNPIRSINFDSLVSKLIQNNICVIAAHTNYDKSSCGVNYVLAEKLGLKNIKAVNDECGVLVGELSVKTSSFNIADLVKTKLGVKYVKITNKDILVQKIAVCGGSGRSYINDVIKSGADLFISAEFKHSDYADNMNLGLSLLDAGHFETEKISLENLKQLLDLDIEIIVSDNDVCHKYI